MYWPPLFPTLLAGLYLVGIDPLDGARFLNAGICGFIVFCSGLLFMKTIRNAFLLVFGFLMILFSGPLLSVCNYAWTEPLFILLAIVSFLYLAQFLRNEQWSSLVLFSCCAALACLARYIGVTVVLAGCTAILIFMRQGSFLKRLKYAVFSAGLALAPLAAWCIRNYTINSTLTGGRNPGDLPVIWNVWLCLKTIAEWFIPDILPPSLTKPAVLMNIVSGMVILLMFFRLKAANKSRPSAKYLLAAYGFIAIYLLFLFKTLALWFIPHLGPSFLKVPLLENTVFGIVIIALFFWLLAGHEARPSAKELLATYSFLIIYSLFLIVAASTAGFDPINSRLLCPVYVFLVCAALAAGDRLAALAGQKQKKYVWLVFTLLAVWFISWPCRTSLSMMSMQHNAGTVFSNRTLQQSPLLEWLRRNPLEGTIYCNAQLVIYLYTGIESYDSTNKPHDVIDAFKKSLSPSKAICLIWYTNNPEGALYTHDEIAAQLPFETVKKFPDGAVLRLRN